MIRDRCSLNLRGTGPLGGKVCHRAFSDIEVWSEITVPTRDGQALTAAEAPIIIFHFPLRSYQQFANKVALGRAALARSRPPTFCSVRLQRYAMWQRGELEGYYEEPSETTEQSTVGLRKVASYLMTA